MKKSVKNYLYVPLKYYNVKKFSSTVIETFSNTNFFSENWPTSKKFCDPFQISLDNKKNGAIQLPLKQKGGCGM